MSNSETFVADMPTTENQTPKFILSLRVGGSLMAMSLTRHSCAEPPTERTICYLDNGDERLFLGSFKNGQWRDGRGKLLTSTPAHWFAIEMLG